MGIVSHILIFLLSSAVIWFLSGMLVEATERVARRFNKPGFAVAFFVLGFLTSISEISVAFNSTLEGVPQVSAGNLLGASLVIFLLIIPILAVLGDGVPMKQTFRKGILLLALGIIFLPTVLALDGTISVNDGIIMLLFYAVLIFKLRKKHPAEKTAKQALGQARKELLEKRHATESDLFKIFIGAVLIFIAGHLLVSESVYFAGLFSIPVSFVGLLLLSIGTNIPELVIAIRCVLGRHKDVAFGDYMGSAAANTVILGVLVLANGSFQIEQSEALIMAPLFLFGLLLFYFFSRTKNNLSRREGSVLLILYLLFVASQVLNMSRFAGPGPDQELLMQPVPGQEAHAAAVSSPIQGQE